MGGSSSKVAKNVRKYPSRPPPTSQTPPAQQRPACPHPAARQPSEPGAPSARAPAPSQTPPQHEQATTRRSPAVDLDARDPHLASHLQRLGPVQPNPTFSPSSATGAPGPAPSPANNASLAILAARDRIQADFERQRIDAGKPGFGGKRLLDVGTLRKMLVLRDEEGMAPGDIERALGLREGAVAGLGRAGVVEAA